MLLFLRFWPNTIQQDEDCSGTCFTTHRRHPGVFSFRTKAPLVIGLNWIGIVVGLRWIALDCLGVMPGGNSIFFLIATFSNAKDEHEQQNYLKQDR